MNDKAAWDDDQKKQWIDTAAAKYKTRRGDIKIPITIEGRNVVANQEGSKTIYVQALQVQVAAPAARLAHDIVKTLSMKGKNEMNIIPATLRRDNPDMYYKTVKKHAKMARKSSEHTNIFGSKRQIWRDERTTDGKDVCRGCSSNGLW